MNTVKLDVQDHIALVTLNRPEALNAFNIEMRREMADLWRQFEQTDDIRVGIVTGEGKAFCAGMDIKERAQQIQEGARRDANVAPESTTSVFYSARECSKPLIAAVNGAAAGGGLGLVLACDFAIAAENAVFILSLAARGAFNPTILGLLATKVPMGWASWMAFSAARIDAPTALHMGLVNEVLPREQLVDRAYEMAERILSTSYVSVLASKEKLRQVSDIVQQTMAVEGPHAQAFNENSESAEGFTAFAEKRRAQFD